jgi:tetratricopeptide (TPR) repeat protein
MKNPVANLRSYWFAVSIGVVLLCGVLWVRWLRRPTAEQLVSAARMALLRKDSEAARQLALRGLSLYPKSGKLRLTTADIESELNHLEEALAHLEQVVDDGSPTALLAMRSGQFDTHELALLADPEQVYENPDLTAHLSKPRPNDSLLMQATARYALFRNEMTKALGLFRQVAVVRPGDLDLQSGLGRALLDAGTEAEFLEWSHS